ncbi:MAG: recombinase family protein, partial [Firmicutes bacterium]|nr:recombinase family protein [Bacillota bacterium]
MKQPDHGNFNICALYLRLSKEDMDKPDKEDDSESIKNQRLLLTEEAIKRGFMIADVYSDDDYSGTDSSRPEFNRLIEDAKLGKFNTVLCKSQSRFTRDMEVAEKYINRIFPLLGIRFIGLTDHIDTDIKGNKKARQINALINEWYVEDLSDNVRSVLRSKMRRGEYLGSFACYGYEKDKNDRHKLIIDEEAAEVVRKIFRYCIEGYSAGGICHKLNEEGIVTPAVYKKNKGLKLYIPNADKYSEKYCLWGVTTIKKILTNEMYIGNMVQGKEKKLSYKSKKVVSAPKEEWIIVENTHEAIISKEDFCKAQEILALRRKCSDKSDISRKTYPLAGKVFCKDCGSSMLRSGKKGTDANYLRCRLAAGSKGKSCSNHNIRYDILERAVLSELQSHIHRLLQDEAVAAEIACEIKKAQKRENPAQKARERLKKLYAEKERLSFGLKSCYMDKYTGA